MESETNSVIDDDGFASVYSHESDFEDACSDWSGRSTSTRSSTIDDAFAVRFFLRERYSHTHTHNHTQHSPFQQQWLMRNQIYYKDPCFKIK